MARTYRMNWDGVHYQWRKMHKGEVFRVTCGELDLPRELWTKEASYQKANRWWEKKYDELSHVTNTRVEAMELLTGQKIETQKQADEALQGFREKIALDPSFTLPDGFHQLWLGKERFEQITKITTDLAKGTGLPVDATIGHHIDQFLAVLRMTQKPQTYREVRDFLGTVKDWFGTMEASQLNESNVAEAYAFLASSSLSQPVKKKRWGFFRRFVRYLYKQRLIDLPRNLDDSTDFRFRVQAQPIKTWPLEEVKQSLACLPDKLRCWALLGLNCGMTNADIGGLRHDMVLAGYLTRKRVKTESHENVPVVKYKL